MLQQALRADTLSCCSPAPVIEYTQTSEGYLASRDYHTYLPFIDQCPIADKVSVPIPGAVYTHSDILSGNIFAIDVARKQNKDFCNQDNAMNARAIKRAGYLYGKGFAAVPAAITQNINPTS